MVYGVDSFWFGLKEFAVVCEHTFLKQTMQNSQVACWLSGVQHKSCKHKMGTCSLELRLAWHFQPPSLPERKAKHRCQLASSSTFFFLIQWHSEIHRTFWNGDRVRWRQTRQKVFQTVNFWQVFQKKGGDFTRILICVKLNADIRAPTLQCFRRSSIARDPRIQIDGVHGVSKSRRLCNLCMAWLKGKSIANIAKAKQALAVARFLFVNATIIYQSLAYRELSLIIYQICTIRILK